MQVLREYFAAMTRKLKIPPEPAQKKVALLSQARVVRMGPPDLIHAIELHRLQQICFWDATIVETARLARASVLYSEEMQHGSRIAGVPVVNPFR